MLVFKDSIMGLVAGIQLTANGMLHVGDWISMSKYGVNGRVTEVTLNTVKVRNWDNTIVTVPPYLLISDSFQNWRPMGFGRTARDAVGQYRHEQRPFLYAGDARPLSEKSGC